MSVDFGLARVGLAISDPGRVIAQPLPAVSAQSALQEITSIAIDQHVSEIVIGLPLNMNGTHSQQTEKTLDFVHRLRRYVNLPVSTWDERLSTVEATRALRGAGKRRLRDKGRIDSASAAVILNSYMNAT